LKTSILQRCPKKYRSYFLEYHYHNSYLCAPIFKTVCGDGRSKNKNK
jgi:hypothetical protein